MPDCQLGARGTACDTASAEASGQSLSMTLSLTEARKYLSYSAVRWRTHRSEVDSSRLIEADSHCILEEAALELVAPNHLCVMRSFAARKGCGGDRALILQCC